MSRKRELIAKVLPNGLPFADILNNNAAFVAMRRRRFSGIPEFAERIGLYRHLATMVGGVPIDYLEFGVWKGDSIRSWSGLNAHPESRFVGFDTFEGLPEDWGSDHPKGTFTTQGQTPSIDDTRVSFIKGLFQQTLKPFLASRPLISWVER